MRNRLHELLREPSAITTDIVIEPTLAGMVQALLSRIGFSDKQLLLLCDSDTYAASAEKLAHELSTLKPRLLKLHGKVCADEASLQLIRNYKADAFIAVGSGTLNDLCKYASYEDGKPYAVFPTAPSMNGYLSANASLTLKGVKESRKAHLPSGVFCDVSVIAAAPRRLIRSGLGDSVCRPTAQADWLLSHLLLDTYYTPEPFDLVAPYEAELFAHADKLMQGDPHMIELLMKTLLVSGLGMTLAGGSYPASQGEHMIAHAMEMKHGDALPETYHGEQIGVTTLTMAKIQGEKLSRRLQLPGCPRWEEGLQSYFGPERASVIAQSSQGKYRLYDRYDAIASRLTERDLHIRDLLRRVTLPEARLHEILSKAGAPVTPAQLGWSEREYETAVSQAKFTRNRFTFLDLL